MTTAEQALRDRAARAEAMGDTALRDGPTYIDATEEAHYHPEAGRMWNRWMLRCERRGITYDAVALAEAALANADARDPLNGYRNCILRRNGRECRSYAGRPCAADCDIPF